MWLWDYLSAHSNRCELKVVYWLPRLPAHQTLRSHTSSDQRSFHTTPTFPSSFPEKWIRDAVDGQSGAPYVQLHVYTLKRKRLTRLPLFVVYRRLTSVLLRMYSSPAWRGWKIYRDCMKLGTDWPLCFLCCKSIYFNFLKNKNKQKKGQCCGSDVQIACVFINWQL